MTMKQVDETPERKAVPVAELGNLPTDLHKSIKYAVPQDEDMTAVSQLRATSEPWQGRGESAEQSLEALTKLRPFIQVAKLQTQVVGYVTIERDGPVPGAAYMRNIVVKPELRRKGVGSLMLAHAAETAREMYRRTIALRVDPANGPAVNFYRKAGFTTVATVVSKKSGKLRLLMSREL
jgi:[ribosomal protein S18]-alanine N-acetyltransferase